MLQLVKGAVNVIHAGPTCGKSFITKASRREDPHLTGLLAYDTDDFIWLWRPAWFMDRLWAKEKSEESKDAEALTARIFDGILGGHGIETHPEITHLILTNLWPPKSYASYLRASFFRTPEAMVAVDIKRRKGRAPFTLEKTQKWYDSWKAHFHNVFPAVPRFELSLDEHVSEYLEWDFPSESK